MKVCILSDLHLEMANADLIPIECDIMILAGDIGTGTSAKDFIIWHLNNGVKHILYVLGNHEFWHEMNLNTLSFFGPSLSSCNIKHPDSYNFTLDSWLELDNQIERLHVLHNKEFIYENVRFLGTTLWTDFDRKVENQKLAAENMNDYKYITYENRDLQPHDVFNFHINAKKWLENKLKDEDKNSELKEESKMKTKPKTVVISHHLPSYSCVHQQYEGNPLNFCFASRLDKLMEKYIIDYWIHGHTHTPVNIKLYDTQIICNPRGYIRVNEYGEHVPENSLFDYKNMIEI